MAELQSGEDRVMIDSVIYSAFKGRHTDFGDLMIVAIAVIFVE